MRAIAYSRRLTSGPPARLIAAIALAAVLQSACATRKSLDLPPMDDWETREQVLGGIGDWEFNGRIGVSAGDDGFTGSLRWTQRDDAFQATVSGPLGIGTVRLEGDGRSVELTDKDGIRTRLDNAEADLYIRYGWTIPVQSLRYWALGIPDPSRPSATSFNDDGYLEDLEQGNWRVSIGRYGNGGGQLMPTRLTAVNTDTKVRLVIHKWLFFDQSLK